MSTGNICFSDWGIGATYSHREDRLGGSNRYFPLDMTNITGIDAVQDIISITPLYTFWLLKWK